MKWMYNGQVIDHKDLTIPVNDHGFLYGIGLFETFRVYDATAFLFDEHMSRLQKGLPLIGIDFRLSKTEILQQLKLLLETNSVQNAYIRLTITAGEAPLGLPAEKYNNPSVIWQIKSLGPIKEGVTVAKKAVILKQRRNLPETSIRLKSLNFLNNVLAKQEILNEKDTEGFFLTHEGYLAEGIVSNIFFIKDNKLYTPSLNTGILNGITRQHVINISKRNNIPIAEGLFTPEDLYRADSIFITNSIQEIVRITTLDGIEYPYHEDDLIDFLVKEYKSSVKEAILKNKER